MAVQQIAIAFGIAYITWCLLQYGDWKKQRGSPRTAAQNEARDDPIHPALYVLSFPFALVYATIKGLLYITRTLVMHSLLLVEKMTPRVASWLVPRAATFMVSVFEAISQVITKLAGILGNFQEPLTDFLVRAFYLTVLAPGMWLFNAADFLFARIYMAGRKFAVELYADAVFLGNVLTALIALITDKGLLPALAFIIAHAITFGRSAARTVYAQRHTVSKRFIEGFKNSLQQLVIMGTNVIQHPASQWTASTIMRFLQVDAKEYWPSIQARLEYCAFDMVSATTQEIRNVSLFARRIIDLAKSASPRLIGFAKKFSIHSKEFMFATMRVATKITILFRPVAIQLHAAGRSIFVLIQNSRIHVAIIKSAPAVTSILQLLMRALLRTSTILFIKAARLSSLAWQQAARHATYLDSVGKHVSATIARSVKALDWAVVKIGEEIASAAKSA